MYPGKGSWVMRSYADDVLRVWGLNNARNITLDKLLRAGKHIITYIVRRKKPGVNPNIAIDRTRSVQNKDELVNALSKMAEVQVVGRI